MVFINVDVFKHYFSTQADIFGILVGVGLKTKGNWFGKRSEERSGKCMACFTKFGEPGVWPRFDVASICVCCDIAGGVVGSCGLLTSASSRVRIGKIF